MLNSFKKYFTFKQRLLLNSNIIRLDNAKANCNELKRKELITFTEIDDFEKIKKKKSNEKDFLKLCLNYDVNVKKTFEDLFTVLPRDSLLDDLAVNKEINLFRSLIFHKFPCYACVSLIDDRDLQHLNFEEVFILLTLREKEGIKLIANYNDIEFTTLLIISLYLNPEKDYDYKQFIKKWFQVKELPLPNFVLSSNYTFKKELYLFFENWLRCFISTPEKKILLKNVPPLKVLDNSLFQNSDIDMNREGDVIEVIIKDSKPCLIFSNYYIFINNDYYFFYKSNFSFYIYQFIKNENNFTNICDNSVISNVVKFSANDSNQELRLKITSDEISSDLFIGQNKFSLNADNNYQFDLIIDNNNEENIMTLFELTDILFEKQNILRDENKCNDNFKCVTISNLKGLQYYNITYNKKISLLITNPTYDFRTYFILSNDLKDNFLNESEFKFVSNDYSSKCLLYFFDETFNLLICSFYENIIDYTKIIINESVSKFDLLIKNMIVDDRSIFNKIEFYWILKKLGKIQLDYFENINHFDKIDQSLDGTIKKIDEKQKACDILASNIKIVIKNLNIQDFKFCNIIYLSLLTCLSFSIEHLHLPRISQNSDTFFYLQGAFDLQQFECNYYVYLNSFNPNIKYMRLVSKKRNIDSSNIIINLLINYNKNNENEIYIESNKFILPAINEMKILTIFEFFYEKKFKALFGFHIPLINII